MARRQTFITPVQHGRTVALSNGDNGLPVFRKRVLPLGRIKHPDTGEWVTFDHAYHQSLIDAFNAGAAEQMPLQLANDRNQHNMSPELTRAIALRLSHQQAGDSDGPGLYADFQPTSRKAAKLLQQNPGLGVSCQIVEGRERVDGKRFPRVLRHVLATLDPRVVGLGRWRPVSLSDDVVGDLVDLTGAKIKEIPVAKSGSKSGALELSEEEAEAIVDSVLQEAEAALNLSNLAPGNAERMAQLRAMAGKGKKKGKKAKGGKKGKPIGLSNDDGTGLNLAVELDATQQELAAVQADLAKSRWEREKATTFRGVPKALLDLAEPVLASASPAVLSLSNSDGDPEEVDAAEVIRDILSVVPRLDLSEAEGTSVEPGADAEVEALDKEWDELSGSVD